MQVFYGSVNSISAPEISLHYIDSFGWTKEERKMLKSIPGKPKPMAINGTATFPVERTLGGNIKIIISTDLDVYYIKN